MCMYIPQLICHMIYAYVLFNMFNINMLMLCKNFNNDLTHLL